MRESGSADGSEEHRGPSRRQVLGAAGVLGGAAVVGLGAGSVTEGAGPAGAAGFRTPKPVPGWDGFHLGAASSGFQVEGYYPDSNFVHVDTGAFRTW